MYDDAELRRSRFYFSLLQLLRIFSTSISRSMRDLDELACQFMEAEPVGCRRDIRRDWDIILARHKRSGDQLLERIGQYTEDVKSLRDGVRSPRSHPKRNTR